MYAERSIPEENFFDICVRENPEEYIGKKELYDYYVRYCNKVKISPKTLNKFGAYIKKNVNWIDKEDMKATKKVLGVVFAIWPNTFFDKAAFNNWLNNKD